MYKLRIFGLFDFYFFTKRNNTLIISWLCVFYYELEARVTLHLHQPRLRNHRRFLISIVVRIDVPKVGLGIVD